MPDLYADVSLHKRDIEGLFCASVALNPEGARKDCTWLSPEKFTDDRWKKYWESIMAGESEDTAMVRCGDAAGLMSISAANQIGYFSYKAYASLLTEEAYFLNISNQLPTLARAIADRDLKKVSSIITMITDERPLTGDTIPNALDMALEFDTYLREMKPGMKLGIDGLDAATGGLDNDTLTLIAARPSMGKTSLGLQIARNCAAMHRKVLFFSLEMSRRQLWMRMACGLQDVDIRDVRAMKVDEDTIDRLSKQAVDLAGVYGDNFLVDDSTDNTTETIWRKVAKYEPEIVILDHTSLVNDKAESNVLRVGKIAWGGKQIAKEFHIPVIYLQQLNRGTENNFVANKRPTMANLRDSGELEQNADNVIFIYRDDYYEQADEKNLLVSPTELIIAKFRDGVRNICVHTQYDLRKQWFFGKDYTR